jgi:hypothetical protein
VTPSPTALETDLRPSACHFVLERFLYIFLIRYSTVEKSDTIYVIKSLNLVADEGHILKNAQTALAKCLSKIKTPRRIVLTGTPLQNNLIE